MVLVNAIHLELPWAHPFDASATAPSSFTVSDTTQTTTVSAPFMNQQTNLPYVDDGQAQIVGLPLAQDGRLAVIVALPHMGVDLAAYEEALTPSSLALALPSSISHVQLSLPKLQFTSGSFSLVPALEAMGMPVAFDPANADFLGICSDLPPGVNLYIHDVLQETAVTMAETRVQASAATAVVMFSIASSPPPPTPVPMVVNRPYFYSIVDAPTGAVLFMGHVVDPTQTTPPGG
jgi:serpin B